MKLRSYQDEGLRRAETTFAAGVRRVLLVAPTGAGKGTMAAEAIGRALALGQRVMFLVHRREIVRDIAKRLGKLGIGADVILPGAKRARSLVTVASVQSLLDKETLPDADLLVVDEAHHYAADEWGALLARYPDARVLGFTATPQRADGRGMGDVFETLIVVAEYSELVSAGHIVPCTVWRPPSNLGIDLALDPLDAYRRHASGQPALVYARRVDEARALTARFRAAGIAAACIHGGTATGERDDTLARFADGRLTIVVNVFCLTEGIDVPRASAIVLARTCEHVSTYVQIVGRALRAHPGKTRAVLLDLVGVSHRHGLPTDDRAYSLEGSGMGVAIPAQREGEAREERLPRVLGVELAAVGEQAPAPLRDLKRERWDVLAAEVEAGARTVVEAVEAYRAQFGERPAWVASLSGGAVERERRRLIGLHPILGAVRFREIFG